MMIGREVTVVWMALLCSDEEERQEDLPTVSDVALTSVDDQFA